MERPVCNCAAEAYFDKQPSGIHEPECSLRQAYSQNHAPGRHVWTWVEGDTYACPCGDVREPRFRRPAWRDDGEDPIAEDGDR